MNAAHRMRVRAPHTDASKVHGELGAAVKAAAQREEFVVLRINGGEEQRPFIRLGARRTKEGFPEVSRRDGGQPLRKEHEFFRQVDVADVLQGLDLLIEPVRDFGVAMAAVDDGNAGEAIQIFFPRVVEQILHGAAHQLRRLPVKVRKARHDILPLLLDDLLRTDVFFHDAFLLLIPSLDLSKTKRAYAQLPWTARRDFSYRRHLGRSPCGVQRFSIKSGEPSDPLRCVILPFDAVRGGSVQRPKVRIQAKVLREQDMIAAVLVDTNRMTLSRLVQKRVPTIGKRHVSKGIGRQAEGGDVVIAKHGRVCAMYHDFHRKRGVL